MTDRDQSRITLKVKRIRRIADVPRYVDNCHSAPARYGWVGHPDEWPHSSLRNMAVSEMILS